MSDEKKDAEAIVAENQAEYQSPAIEEVVTREGFEREVAYAGIPGPSNNTN